jgi:hypothetical protein
VIRQAIQDIVQSQRASIPRLWAEKCQDTHVLCRQAVLGVVVDENVCVPQPFQIIGLAGIRLPG